MKAISHLGQLDREPWLIEFTPYRKSAAPPPALRVLTVRNLRKSLRLNSGFHGRVTKWAGRPSRVRVQRQNVVSCWAGFFQNVHVTSYYHLKPVINTAFALLLSCFNPKNGRSLTRRFKMQFIAGQHFGAYFWVFNTNDLSDLENVLAE